MPNDQYNNDATSRILASQIVTSDCLDKTLRRLATANQAVTERAIITDLIKRGKMSLWQGKQLAAGRFKGFVWDNYLILKLYPGTTKFRMAEAFDYKSKSYVLLRAAIRDAHLEVDWVRPLSADDHGKFPKVSIDAMLKASEPD